MKFRFLRRPRKNRPASAERSVEARLPGNSFERPAQTRNVPPPAGRPRRSGTMSKQLTVNLLVISALNVVAGLVMWLYGSQPQYAYPMWVAGAVAFAVLLGLSRSRSG